MYPKSHCFTLAVEPFEINYKSPSCTSICSLQQQPLEKLQKKPSQPINQTNEQKNHQGNKRKLRVDIRSLQVESHANFRVRMSGTKYNVLRSTACSLTVQIRLNTNVGMQLLYNKTQRFGLSLPGEQEYWRLYQKKQNHQGRAQERRLFVFLYVILQGKGKGGGKKEISSVTAV